MVLVSAVVSHLAVAALPDPMVWFNMKESSGTTVADASGNGHTLTLGATVQVVDDVLFGKAIKVTGLKSDYATFSCPVVTNTTIAYWIKRDAQDSSIMNGTEQNTIPYVMSCGYSGFGINYARNKLDIGLINQQNSPQTNYSGANPAREEWHHMAFAIEYADDGNFGTLTCRCYLDGVLKNTTSQVNNRAMKTPPAPQSNQNTQDVVLFNNAVNGYRPTSGLYADLRFYNSCLDATQIRILASEGAGKRLVMRYAFEEIGEAVDANGRHSTPEATGLSSAMTLGKNMTLVDDGVDGKALRFMGTTEIGGQVKAPVLSLVERTYSVWVRNSSRRSEMNAIVANPYPRLIDGHTSGNGGGYCIFSDSSGMGRSFQYMPAGCSTSAKATTNYGLAEIDTWSHLAIVEHYDANGNGITDLYVNGEDVTYGIHQTYTFEALPGGISFFVGNASSFTGNRFFCGDLDEFRVYNYALSRDEVKRLYRGLAKIDAGADFTVAGTKGVLHGTIAANAGDGYRKGYAGEIAWSLVSGAGATILQPNAAETEVTLPAPGTYVFRLSITDLGVTKSDDVTVTCVAADGANQAPSISVVASAQAITQPDLVTLTATVSDDNKPAPALTRVRWTKKSGPGGVWFEPDDALATKASFGAAGTYVLTCTADDGQATASADVTVAVADRTDGKNLSTDLLHYFSLDGQCDPYFKDQGSISPKKNLTAPNYSTLRYVPGKVGNGARAYAYSGNGSRWTTATSIGEVAMDDPTNAYGGSNLPPANEYLTVSAWIYVDPADTNLVNGNICGATVVGQGYTFGLRYNEKWSPNAAVNTGGFSLYQQGRGGDSGSGGIGMAMAHYPVPSPSPLGRWMHICGIWSRKVSDFAAWEMWYDGVKQTMSSSTGGCRGRINGNSLNIGGMEYTQTNANSGDYNQNWAKPGVTAASSDASDYYSRTFPGIVDEVRIWTRKLTPEEIRYLAANPMIGENKGPAVDAPASTPRKPIARKSAQISTAVFVDQLPSGGALTYEWSILSGDASLATIGDTSAASTTFTATKAGEYVLQLKVSDGERTVYSKPLTVEVTAQGMMVIIK